MYRTCHAPQRYSAFERCHHPADDRAALFVRIGCAQQVHLAAASLPDDPSARPPHPGSRASASAVSSTRPSACASDRCVECDLDRQMAPQRSEQLQVRAIQARWQVHHQRAESRIQLALRGARSATSAARRSWAGTSGNGVVKAANRRYARVAPAATMPLAASVSSVGARLVQMAQVPEQRADRSPAPSGDRPDARGLDRPPRAQLAGSPPLRAARVSGWSKPTAPPARPTRSAIGRSCTRQPDIGAADLGQRPPHHGGDVRARRHDCHRRQCGQPPGRRALPPRARATSASRPHERDLVADPFLCGGAHTGESLPGACDS